MAAKFENKLVDCLGYRGPWLMRDLLERLAVNGENMDTKNGSNVGSRDDATLVTTHGSAAKANTRYSNTGAVSSTATVTGTSTNQLASVVHLRPKGEWRILDVGCGSGLCGKIFNHYVHNVHSPSLTSSAGTQTSAEVSIGSSTNTISIPPTTANLPLSAVPFTTGGLMVGIDVSGKILEIAKRTGTYDCTEKYDLCEALRVLDFNKPEIGMRTGLDMVIAADTFIYVGALGEVFSLVRNVLRDAVCSSHSQGRGAVEESSEKEYGGLFMFSTEDFETSPMRVAHSISTTITTNTDPTTINTPATTTNATTANTSVDVTPVVSTITDVDIEGAIPGWGGQMLKSARFAHSDRYIRALCEKYRFRVLVHEKIVLRTEETIPLPGNIYILQKLE